MNYGSKYHTLSSLTLFGFYRSSSRREDAGGAAYLLSRSAQWKLRYVRARARVKERTLYLFPVSHGMLRFCERKRE